MREECGVAEVSLATGALEVPWFDGETELLREGVLPLHKTINYKIPPFSNFPVNCYKLPNIHWQSVRAVLRQLREEQGVGQIQRRDNNMMGNNNCEEEECFLLCESEETATQEVDMRLDIPKRIKEQLPANELRTVRRPDNMAPRTFFLDYTRTLLPPILNAPCLELPPAPTDPARLKLRIVNSKNLPLQQYFKREKFRCLYNRLEGAREEGKTFLGRLKGIDSLVDYNWKNFRELPQETVVSGGISDRIDADFQSGNICRAYEGAEQRQYYLLVQNDVNTYGYNNWFFFRCCNRGTGVRRFTLANLAKKTSFFGQGMAISIFSRKRHEREGEGWFKGGERITYGNINFLRTHHDNDYYSCLSFEYDFQEEEDEVFFALNQPYTYSRLVRCLQIIRQQRRNYVQVKNIGYSIANNIIPVVRINKHPATDQVVLVIARQHPCETTGSFIAEYLIKQLLASSAEAQKHLLSQFQFVIVPMVNPDGVIHGMSRCNVAGLDLNRHWGEDTLKELTPQVVKVKQLISTLSKTKRIRYMVDLHGHGKKLSSFFFCCGSERQHYRLLSLAMRKIQRRFSLTECTYGISRDKENTIRSKINSMGIGHSYTLETSLFGWRNQQGEVRHFNQYDYQQIADSLLKSIFLIEAPQPLTMTVLGTTKQALFSEMSSFSDPAQQPDRTAQDHAELLSDSDPQGDRLDVKDLLGKCQNKALKKKLEQLQRRKAKKKGLFSKTTNRINKDMRDSSPHGFYHAKVSTALGRELIVKLQAKSNAKKVSFSEKWEVRRQRIVERQQKLQNQSVQREMGETGSTLASKPQRRTRINSQISYFVDKKLGSSSIAPSAAAKHALKKKHLPLKMKTEFKEAEQLVLSQEEIQQSEYRKSALQLRFKQLRQESLNVMLTDTLSISQMLPPQKEREKQRPRQHRSIKDMPASNKHDFLPTEPAARHSMKGESSEGVERGQPYKKFQQFLAGQSPNRKREKSVNSVFYYFPIL